MLRRPTTTAPLWRPPCSSQRSMRKAALSSGRTTMGLLEAQFQPAINEEGVAARAATDLGRFVDEAVFCRIGADGGRVESTPNDHGNFVHAARFEPEIDESGGTVTTDRRSWEATAAVRFESEIAEDGGNVTPASNDLGSFWQMARFEEEVDSEYTHFY